jgi:xylosylprotein 4-beta-galactosyltransferase
MAIYHLQNALPTISTYSKSLAIVVPYRDRAEHLCPFISHMLAYFERDKLDRQIPISIHIVEQSGSAPFNVGRVKNCGYMLARDLSDYVCFHDVDYLPIWADYSWSLKPARLAWHGLALHEDWETYFGAVVVFNKPAFERVNGYPNVYWGWGPEDKELGVRCVLTGLGFDRRDGTYRALPHKHAGFAAPGVYTDDAQRNLVLYETRRERIRELIDVDGLRNLKFETIRRVPVKLNDVELPNAFHYLVDIGNPE